MEVPLITPSRRCQIAVGHRPARGPDLLPRANYPFEIATAGNYYVHFRARGNSQADSDNSIYLTVNGNTGSFQNVTTPPISLTWVKAANPIALPAGLSTINVWMREDGRVIDRLSVNTSATGHAGRLGACRKPAEQSFGRLADER